MCRVLSVSRYCSLNERIVRRFDKLLQGNNGPVKHALWRPTPRVRIGAIAQQDRLELGHFAAAKPAAYGCVNVQEQDQQGDATNDRTCKSCVDGTTFKSTVGQASCEAVANCVFPDREKTVPTASSNRVCECDVTGCDVLISAAFSEFLCRSPSEAEAAQRIQGKKIPNYW